jgi:hypothetical protein
MRTKSRYQAVYMQALYMSNVHVKLTLLSLPAHARSKVLDVYMYSHSSRPLCSARATNHI